MIWIPMSEMILLYLLQISEGLALHLGQYLHHMNRMDLIEKGTAKLGKLQDYHHQVPALPLLLLRLKKILKHRQFISFGFVLEEAFSFFSFILSDFPVATQELENKEELKSMLKDAIREKSDVFNSENSEEDKVCMHQTYLITFYIVYY